MDAYTESVTHYETAIALLVELQRIVSTMPDPVYEVKAALADVHRFLKRRGREHQLD